MPNDELRVVVVGGGIGGVAAAAALHRRGVRAEVYEQAPSIEEVGAGIGLHPNGVRMLRRLGLGAQLERRAARWRSASFLRSDGCLIAPWWPADSDSPPEVFGVHRADLLQLLLDVLPPGVVHTGRRAVGFEQDDRAARVRFADGSEAVADVVIAADGVHSQLQQHVAAPSPLYAAGSVVYRGVLPAASLDWPVDGMRSWLGSGRHFMVFPVRGQELLCFGGFVPGEGHPVESWSGRGDVSVMRAAYEGWDDAVGQILERIDVCFWSGLYDRDPLPHWTSGRLALLGDAAHPMLPHVGQGATQALEDALTLGVLLAHADRDTAPAWLRRYEELRLERTARVQSSARFNGSRYESDAEDLGGRDRELSNQARDRAWMWDFDAVAGAESAVAELVRL